MLTFLKTGHFGPIAGPITSEELLKSLGEPDEVSPAIWWYGSFEFHFEDRQLVLIFADHFEKLREGRRLELDAGPLFGGTGEADVTTGLEQAGIGYTSRVADYDPDQTLIVTEGGVELSFVTNTAIYSRLGLETITRRWPSA